MPDPRSPSYPRSPPLPTIPLDPIPLESIPPAIRRRRRLREHHYAPISTTNNLTVIESEPLTSRSSSAGDDGMNGDDLRILSERPARVALPSRTSTSTALTNRWFLLASSFPHGWDLDWNPLAALFSSHSTPTHAMHDDMMTSATSFFSAGRSGGGAAVTTPPSLFSTRLNKPPPKYSLRLSHQTGANSDPHCTGKRKGWSYNIAPPGSEDSVPVTAATTAASSSTSSAKKKTTKKRVNAAPICTDCLRVLVLGAPSSKSLAITLDLTESDNENTTSSNKASTSSSALPAITKKPLSYDIGRPWALKCGHLICTQCIQEARSRHRQQILKRARKTSTSVAEIHVDDDDDENENDVNDHVVIEDAEMPDKLSSDLFEIIDDPVPMSSIEKGKQVQNDLETDSEQLDQSIVTAKTTTIADDPTDETNRNSTDDTTSSLRNGRKRKRPTTPPPQVQAQAQTQSETIPAKKSRKKATEYTIDNFDYTPISLKKRNDPHVNHAWIHCPVKGCVESSLAFSTLSSPVQDTLSEAWELFV